MNQWLLLSFFCYLASWSSAQQTLEGSIQHDGLERTYILYVPAVYDPGTPAPLVFDFHGYTSNNLEQMFYGDFRPIADTAGFLVVHPMGTDDQLGNPHWNVGWGASTVDDVGFTNALIDSLSASYTIDPDRIYSTGMSNGGFFSYKLACELSDRIAAIASVTGTMNANQSATCQPSHPMPVMEIHGTADDVVAYNGNLFFASTPSVVNFWVQENNCNPTPVFTSIEDSDPADGCTAEHYLYADGSQGATVEHYKIIDGGHTWPGTFFGGAGTNQDMDASKEIWRFFNQFDIHGRIDVSSNQEVSVENVLKIYPVPAKEVLHVTTSFASASPYTIYTMSGKALHSGLASGGQHAIDISALPAGMYVLRMRHTSVKFIKSM